MRTNEVRGAAWTNYVLLFASYVILTLYLQLFLKARGLPLSRIGLVLGILALAGIGGPIILGHLADRLSAYRFFLFAGLLVSIIAFMPLQLTTALPVFVVCIAIMGFSYRAAIPLLDSLLGRIFPDPARQCGGLRVAGSVSFTVVSLGLPLCGAISGDFSVSMLAAFGAAAALTAMASHPSSARHSSR
jgi:MFS family permease